MLKREQEVLVNEQRKIEQAVSNIIKLFISRTYWCWALVKFLK